MGSTCLCEQDLRAALALVERLSDVPDVRSYRREALTGLGRALGCELEAPEAVDRGPEITPEDLPEPIGIDIEARGERLGERELELLRLLRPHLRATLSGAKLREQAGANGHARPAVWPPAHSGNGVASLGLDRERLAEHGLTEREAEVLELAGEGLINDAIGIELGISPRTVQKHLERVHAKLGVGTRAAAIAKAREPAGSGA